MQTEAEHNGMFVDQSFPADDTSLYSDYTTPLSSLLGEISWLRPQVKLFYKVHLYESMLRWLYWAVLSVLQEICEHPQLFPDNPVEANPKQGILGDCWLLCACSMLLKNQHLMSKVNPFKYIMWDVLFDLIIH